MIKPTIGRVVWYWPELSSRGDQPYAAIVAYVWSDDLVNLAVFDRNGHSYNMTSVPLVQDGGSWTPGPSPYAEWMRGQTEKTEALEAKFGAG